MQAIVWALSFALLNAGSSSAARIAMMAMTTRSSIKVKAELCDLRDEQRQALVFMAAGTLPSALKNHKPSIPFLLCANGPTRSNGTFSKSASGNQAQRCEEADFSPKLHVGPPPHV